MKIRVMGTEPECQAEREYYRGFEKEGTEGNELKAAKEKTPEKSDVGTVESIYDLFKPNKRPL